MNRTFYLAVIIFFLSFSTLHAQDSLLAALKKEMVPVSDKQFATFKASRLINVQTNETTGARSLEFRVSHRFGNFPDHNNTGGIHRFFGLDDPAFDIRIGLDYGLTDRLMIGISRSKQDENVEGHAKVRLLQQTMSNKMPVSVSLFACDAYTPKLDPEGIFTSDLDRFSYATELIVARKFSSVLSLEVISSLVHRNVITNSLDDNIIYSVGGGGRWKITKSFNLVADYIYDFRNAALKDVYYNPLGAGIEIETGGHVFSLMFTNSQYILEQELITNTTDSWAKNGWKFCFNISRTFYFKKKE